jgi:hypothetical protein
MTSIAALSWILSAAARAEIPAQKDLAIGDFLKTNSKKSSTCFPSATPRNTGFAPMTFFTRPRRCRRRIECIRSTKEIPRSAQSSLRDKAQATSTIANAGCLHENNPLDPPLQ